VSDYDLKRQLLYGILNLVLGIIAAWLATYLTNKILGQPPEPDQAKSLPDQE
jgi:hypothetical protein